MSVESQEQQGIEKVPQGGRGSIKLGRTLFPPVLPTESSKLPHKLRASEGKWRGPRVTIFHNEKHFFR